MSEAFYIYECHNCNHVFSAKVLVEDVGQCMKCRHDSVYLKPQSTGVYEERVERKDVLEVLSKFSTKELIEALKLKEDVQIADTSEDTYKISMDLMEVKKHVLVINNCDPQLVEHQRRALEANMIWFASGCK
jgi:predicted Rdx family selenoprotein